MPRRLLSLGAPAKRPLKLILNENFAKYRAGQFVTKLWEEGEKFGPEVERELKDRFIDGFLHHYKNWVARGDLDAPPDPGFINYLTTSTQPEALIERLVLEQFQITAQLQVEDLVREGT